MATKRHFHSRRTRRRASRRIATVVANSSLLVFASHTLATIIVIALQQIVHLPR